MKTSEDILISWRQKKTFLQDHSLFAEHHGAIRVLLFVV